MTLAPATRAETYRAVQLALHCIAQLASTTGDTDTPQYLSIMQFSWSASEFYMSMLKKLDACTLLGTSWLDHVSCRDVSGHGTHTAATAGGNYGPTTSEVPTGMAMSGMAPRARLAVYKVCLCA